MSEQTIARIDAVTGRVVNIEVADLEWITANADPSGPYLFVPYDETNPAARGLAWEPIGGFHDPGDAITAEDVAAADQLVADKVAAVELAEATLDAAPTKGTK